LYVRKLFFRIVTVITAGNFIEGGFMIENKIITPEELHEFGSVVTLNDIAEVLVKQQQATWPLAGKNYAALTSVLVREFNFGHFNIEVHYNPERLRSSAAHTDAESIAQRQCFLCAHNLPPQQKGILFNTNYIILANPFPIFPVHLTIAHKQHIPQRVDVHFKDMLNLSRQLNNFTIFYNGPQCGASAPDHFHFQAVKKGFLPIETELNTLRKQKVVKSFQDNGLEIFAVENYLRRFVAIISKDKKKIQKIFYQIYQVLKENENEEPMMNVLTFYEDGNWHLIIFPRAQQRPSHFFKSGNNQIIVGPAAVEMAGVLILPRLEDFNKINEKILTELYHEVTCSIIDFQKLCDQLKLF